MIGNDWKRGKLTHPVHEIKWVSGQQLSEQFQNCHQEFKQLLSDLHCVGCHAVKRTWIIKTLTRGNEIEGERGKKLS